MKRVLIILFAVLSISCVTRYKYIKADLPNKPFDKPIKPNIDLNNLDKDKILLMQYAEGLNICIDKWEQFYTDAKKEISND